MENAFNISLIICTMPLFLYGVFRSIKNFKSGSRDDAIDKSFFSLAMLLIIGLNLFSIMQSPT